MSRARSRRAKAAADESGVDYAVACAEAIGVHFADLGVLRIALMHRSVVKDLSATAPGLPPVEERQSNERLEFLGDAILGHVAAEYLFTRYPDEQEGVLTGHRAALVRTENLVAWAREIGLNRFLYLGQGEKISSSRRDRMLAGAFEALIAAISLDQGFDAAKRFIVAFIDRDAASLATTVTSANPKGRLQELVQLRYRLPPVYQTISTVGPAHDRTFTVEVLVGDAALGSGVGPSKRDAEQAAASAALEVLEPPLAEASETNGTEAGTLTD